MYLLPMLRPLALAACLVTILNAPATCTPRQPVANTIERDPETLAYYLTLLSQTVHLGPTPLQEATIDQCERLFLLINGYAPPPPEGVDPFAEAAASTADLYEDLTHTFPTLRATWTDTGAHWVDSPTTLTMTRGLSRVLLLELTNQAGTTATLQAASEGAPPASAQPISIDPGRMRPILIQARPEALTDRTLRLLVFEPVQGGRAHALELPVNVHEPAIVRGRLFEGDRPDPWPGRVYAQGSDGLYRHAEAFKGNLTLSEKNIPFRPIMVKLPFFYSDGTFEVHLPPGEATLTLERGYEHPLVSKQVTLAAGKVTSLTLHSERFLDMRSRGWVSGDTHIHWVKNWWDENEDIDLLAMVQRAEDLRVANNLTLYQWRTEAMGGPFVKPDQFLMGPVPGWSGPRYHIQMGEEFRNDNHYGHINLLNIRELIRPIATGPGSGGDENAIDYPLNRTIIEQARRQGGISIEAHNIGPFFSSAVPVNVIMGYSDSLDQLDPVNYYNFLDCGIRIGLSNGSDHPARLSGIVRVYVDVGEAYTYDRWCERLAEGRTFTTSGPLLFLTVNGRNPGEVIDAVPGEPLDIRVEAHSRHPIGHLQLVSNGGEVLAATHAEATKASLSLRIPAGESRWFSARCGPSRKFNALNQRNAAMTSAVYVEVDGQRVGRPEAAAFWIEKIEHHRRRMIEEANFENEAQLREALEYTDQGLARYRALLNTTTD